MKKSLIIKSKRFKIAYFPIPKCACTSLKSLLYKLEFQRNFKKHIKLQRKFVFLFYPKIIKNIHEFWGYQKEEIQPGFLDEYFKFVVIRDPIKRFLSAYKNRILHYKDLTNSDFLKVEKFHEFGLSEYPELNYFVRDLNKYMKVSLLIKHHFSPQSNSLVNDLSFYDLVCPIENMDNLENKLSQIVGNNINIPQIQTKGPKINIKDLTQESLSKIIEFYAKDYNNLQDYYSVEAIKAEFAES